MYNYFFLFRLSDRCLPRNAISGLRTWFSQIAWAGVELMFWTDDKKMFSTCRNWTSRQIYTPSEMNRPEVAQMIKIFTPYCLQRIKTLMLHITRIIKCWMLAPFAILRSTCKAAFNLPQCNTTVKYWELVINICFNAPYKLGTCKIIIYFPSQY